MIHFFLLFAKKRCDHNFDLTVLYVLQKNYMKCKKEFKSLDNVRQVTTNYHSSPAVPYLQTRKLFVPDVATSSKSIWQLPTATEQKTGQLVLSGLGRDWKNIGGQCGWLKTWLAGSAKRTSNFNTSKMDVSFWAVYLASIFTGFGFLHLSTYYPQRSPFGYACTALGLLHVIADVLVLILLFCFLGVDKLIQISLFL